MFLVTSSTAVVIAFPSSPFEQSRVCTNTGCAHRPAVLAICQAWHVSHLAAQIVSGAPPSIESVDQLMNNKPRHWTITPALLMPSAMDGLSIQI